MDFADDERAFVDRAITFCDGAGRDSVLLLVGSRAARLTDAWSDLDLWVLGRREALSDADREVYDATGQVFVDRGDYEAHWTFYDWDDVEAGLATWPDVRMWLLSTARPLHGAIAEAQALIQRCGAYPRDVAERKLRQALGHYLIGCGGALVMAARRREPAASLMGVGQIIDSVCRICCLAECRPFPHAKWRVEVARPTALGQRLFPAIDQAVASIGELIDPPPARGFRQWTPIAALRGLREPMVAGLRKLGWEGHWVDEPTRTIADAMAAEGGRRG